MSLGIIVGWAMLPFIISLIFGISKFGYRKVFWLKDVASFAIAAGVYFAVTKWISQPFMIDLMGEGFLCGILSSVVGYLGVLIALNVYYGAIYAADSEKKSDDTPKAPEAAH